VIAVEREGGVVVWNAAAERLLGWPADEVLGEAMPEVGIRLESLLAGRERRLNLRRRDGTTFPATVTASQLKGQEGELVGVVLLVKDLIPWIGPGGHEAPGTDRQMVAERLGAAFRGIVEATGADLERGGGLEPLARSLADQGRRLLPDISCLIVSVPVGRQDVCTCLAGAGPFAESVVNRTFRRAGSVVGLALAQNRVIERSDMQAIAQEPEVFITAGVNTMRVVPMSTQQPLPDGRQALGAIVFFRSEAKPLSPFERRLLDDFATLVSLSLQRAELRAATERSMTELKLAVDVALDLARSLDVAEVVRRLNRRAAVATNADRCALLRLEGGENGELITVDVYDLAGSEAGIGFRQPVSNQAMIQEAVHSREAVVYGRPRLSSFPGALRDAHEETKHSAAVPLVYGGEVIAVLVLSRRRGHAFTSDEVDTLMLLGGPAALALRNSYLYAQTEEASRVKSDFLDMAAHELRTPLTVISGYLSILREGAFGPAPASWQGPLRILDQKAADLRRLVDDLLLAARLETGRLESVSSPMDLREIVRHVVVAAPVAAADRPQVLTPDDSVMVRGDREQLTRLIEHLVDNALAYRREGMLPWVRVALEARPEAGEARLTVDDRGRGVPAESRERIFERFTRLEEPDHPMVPGTGLGLYIARELARRHRARLELEWSQPGVGSRFTLTVPLLQP
jgi:signal transduction histidine kinase